MAADPSTSTCSCSQPSKGFGIVREDPFSFADDNVFTLLDCSTTPSPIFSSNSHNGGDNSGADPLFDKQGATISTLQCVDKLLVFLQGSKPAQSPSIRMLCLYAGGPRPVVPTEFASLEVLSLFRFLWLQWLKRVACQ
ncbi:hypothetical protein V6N13_005812 [Hibiscus sabdariffa]